MVCSVLTTWIYFHSIFTAAGISQTQTFSLGQFVWQYLTKQWIWHFLMHPARFFSLCFNMHFQGRLQWCPWPSHYHDCHQQFWDWSETKQCHKFSNQMLKNSEMQPQGTSKEIWDYTTLSIVEMDSGTTFLKVVQMVSWSTYMIESSSTCPLPPFQ